MTKVYVIGIGYKPFDKRLKEIVLRADFILASPRLFDIFKRYEEFEAVKGRIEVINNVDATMNFIKSQISGLKSRSVVLLASGDPMFYGIGRRTIEEFGKDTVEIFPDLSSVQVAFARIKEAWDDAFFMSLYHSPDTQRRREPKYGIEDIPSLLKEHKKIAILTDKENNPSAIAKEILKHVGRKPDTVFARSPESFRDDEAISKRETDSQKSALNDEERLPRSARNDNITMYVCEKLGYPDEKTTEGKPGEIAEMEFPEPNVVIIIGTKQATGRCRC